MRKRLLIFLILAVICFNCFSAVCFAEASEKTPVPEITAQNVIMVNTNTGAIVFEKNSTQKIYPASLTKLVTMLVAYDLITDYSQQITATKECFEEIDDYLYVTKINLLAGEVISIDDLMYAIAVKSANEAANALAIHLCGSTAAFIELMNQKAAELGATNTHFVNTNGLHDDEHYTTAEDMLKIASAAFKNETLLKYLSTSYYEIAPTNKTDETRSLNNTNNLIKQSSGTYYKYCKGGKTGTTSKAGYNLASIAENDGTEFILIAMNAPKNSNVGNTIFSDSKALYSWGFENFKNTKVLSESEIITEVEVKLSAKGDHLVLLPKENIYSVVPVDLDLTTLDREITTQENIRAPIKQGDVLGSIVLKKDGIVYAQTDLISATDVERHTVLYYIDLIKQFFENIWVKVIVGILLVLLIVYIIVMITQNHKRKKRRLRRRIKF